MEYVGPSYQSRSEIRSSDDDKENMMARLSEGLVLSCLARVAISSYKSMSGVCRAWRNMLREKYYWETRCDANAVEELIFLGVLISRTDANIASDVCAWHAFEPFSNTWIRIPEMPEDGRVSGTSACVTFDGKFFVIGGELKHSGLPCRTVNYFDTSQFCWKKAAPLAIPRSSCKVGVIENKLYIFGGLTCEHVTAGRDQAGKRSRELDARGDQDAAVVSETVEVYDPPVNRWNLVSHIKVPRRLDYSIAMNGKFLAIGTSGNDLLSLKCDTRGDWTKRADVMGVIFDLQTNQWTSMARGLMLGWQRQIVEVKGRLYCAATRFRVRVYDPDKGHWKPVDVRWPWDNLEMGFPEEIDYFSFRQKVGWELELVNLGGRLCMIGFGSGLQEAFVMVLEVEEHSSEDNGITFCGHVVLLKDITHEVCSAGFSSRPTRLQSCQKIRA